MPVEIERKFLVNKSIWDNIDKPEPEHYRQGYLTSDANTTFRVRVTPGKAYITIKGKSKTIERLEYEYEIPKQEGIELLDNLSQRELEKFRYKIVYAGKLWEVDVFLGKNNGLIVAEIELDSINEAFDKPDWVTNEVSDDFRYSNSKLSSNPFTEW